MDIPTPIRAKILGYAKIYEPIDSHTSKYTYMTILVNKNLTILFLRACRYGKLQIIKLLYKRIDILDNSKKIIEYLCVNGHLEALKFLIDVGVIKPDMHDNIAICYASENGQTDIVKYLVGFSQVDVLVSRNYPLHHASSNGHLETVNFLINLPNIDVYNSDAIHSASISNHIEIVKVLSYYSNIQAKNDAFFCACANNHLDIAKFLYLDPDVDPTIQNNVSLRVAKLCGYTEIVDFLSSFS